MKIHYTKRRLRHSLVFGIIWIILGTAATIFNTKNIFNYGYLLIGVVYLGTHLFEKTKQYLTIEDGILTKNQLTPKKIDLNEIRQIKYFAGDYILKNESSELTINTELIEKESLEKLKVVLETLDAEMQ
jgi:hypothetical protein